jgi:hypothetical protein
LVDEQQHEDGQEVALSELQHPFSPAVDRNMPRDAKHLDQDAVPLGLNVDTVAWPVDLRQNLERDAINLNHSDPRKEPKRLMTGLKEALRLLLVYTQQPIEQAFR